MAEEPRPTPYTVLARRYRPQSFADLIGQEPVVAALTNALTSGRVAHAYLFTGARGVGKTSAARILAKALNCEHGPTPTPCNQCDICLRIATGDDGDVLEIDGASNNKVDEIRELRNNVGFRPQRSRYKIYIIDEVHMLSTSAFNALLKTLEEPPAHVKFIFATTEVHKIPITILSRCQRFDFANIAADRVFDTLKSIVQREKLQADDDALAIVSQRSGGSMRDAQTLLDQLLGFSDGPLTAAKVHDLLGTASDDVLIQLAEAVIAQASGKVIEIVSTFLAQGHQPGELLDQIIDYWRGLMLAHVMGNGQAAEHLSLQIRQQLNGQIGRISLDTVLTGIDVLTTAKGKMRTSSHTRILLEAALVRLTRLENMLAISELAQQIQRGEAMPMPNNGNGPVALKKNFVTAESEPLPSTINGNGATPVESPDWAKVWEKVLGNVGLVCRGYLSNIPLPAKIGPNRLAIRFPREYDSAYSQCRSDESQKSILQALKRVTNEDWHLNLELLNEPAESPPAHREQTATTWTRNRILELPLMQRASKVLDAQLINIDDGFDPDSGAEWSESQPLDEE